MATDLGTLMWLPTFPAIVARPAPAIIAPEQQAFVLPAPLVLAWVDGIYPDAVVRPMPLASEQMATLPVLPRPERTAPLAVTVYPDRIEKLYLSAASHMAALSIPPEVERTAPLASVSFTDAVYRPTFLAPQQLAASELSPLPERTSPLAVVVFPDRVDRPYLLVGDQQAYASNIPPERTAPLAATYYQDSVFRPTFLPTEQLAATELSPVPELTIPLAWEPNYPDRATKLWLVSSEQQAFVLPAPLVLAWIDGIYPDSVTKPYLPTASHMAALSVPPSPERTSALATVVFPDRVDKPYLLVGDQQAIARHPFPYPYEPEIEAFYPDSVYRPSFPATHQLASTELSPKPELSAPLAWSPVYPDRALHPWLAAASHQADTLTFMADVPIVILCAKLTLAEQYSTTVTAASQFIAVITLKQC